MGFIVSKNSLRPFYIIGNFTGIRGNIALSINSYGNLWISYVSFNNNTYFLKVANITLNGTYKLYKEYIIITSPDPIMQPSVLVSESGFNNTVLITWSQKGLTAFSIWVLRLGITFTETPITSKIIPSNFNMYYYIIVVIVIIIELLITAVAIIKNGRSNFFFKLFFHYPYRIIALFPH